MASRPHSPTASELEIPGRLHPVLAILAFLPIMMVILILMAPLVEETPSLLLIPALGVVLICCALLSWTALQTMLGGTVELSPDALKIRRFLSEEVYPWHEIDGCKVTPATGTFGDDALAEVDDRVGVGLFLRNSTRDREHDLDADIVICAGEKVDVQLMMRMAGRIEAAIKRARAPAPRQPVRASRATITANPDRTTAASIAQRRPQRSASPAAKVDPVAQFRNRSR